MNREEFLTALETAAAEGRHVINREYLPRLPVPPLLYALKRDGRFVAGIVASDPSRARRIARSKGIDGVIEPMPRYEHVTPYDGICLLRDAGALVHWPTERRDRLEARRLFDQDWRAQEQEGRQWYLDLEERSRYPG